MATWMNEGEIEEAVEIIAEGAPELAPYARLLSDWKDVVNENSDGWAHWKAGSRCAARLSELVRDAAGNLRWGRPGDMPTAAAMRAALTPIRAAATRHGLPFPDLRAPQVASPGPRR